MFQPPTDNLYKFMAIIGLLLWVGGGLYPWVKAFELERETIVLEAQLDHAEKDPTQSDSVELKKNVKLIQLMLTATRVYFLIGWLSFGFGGFLMIYGFRFWYLRVQKPLDQQLNKP